MEITSCIYLIRLNICLIGFCCRCYSWLNHSEWWTGNWSKHRRWSVCFLLLFAYRSVELVCAVMINWNLITNLPITWRLTTINSLSARCHSHICILRICLIHFIHVLCILAINLFIAWASRLKIERNTRTTEDRDKIMLLMRHFTPSCCGVLPFILGLGKKTPFICDVKQTDKRDLQAIEILCRVE